MQKHLQSPFSTDTRVVKWGDLPGMIALGNGTVNFSVPGYGNIEAETVNFIRESSQTFAWTARTSDRGHVVIVARGNHYVVGSIKTYDAYFSLETIKGGYNVLVKHDVGIDESQGPSCATGPGGEGGVGPTEACDLYTDCPTMIHVLVLLTPEAQEWFLEVTGGNTFIAQLYAWYSVYTLNHAFFNSGIPNKDARFTLEGFDDFNWSNSPFTNDKIAADLATLESNSLIQQRRSETKADVVVLLTDDRYGTFKGLACVGGNGEPCGHAIVVADYLTTPRYTFAHEVGHVLGALHNRTWNGGDDDTDVCGHAYRFNDGGGITQRTILAQSDATTPDDPEARILHFSNPSVKYNGKSTGGYDSRNAHVIRYQACEQGGIWGDIEMLVGIEGPENFCQNQQGIFGAMVTPADPGLPGQPPFTYEWRWNTSGYFAQSNGFGTYLGDTEQITIGVLECPNFYLFLKVSSSDGVHSTRVLEVSTINCDECLDIPQPPPAKDRAMDDPTETNDAPKETILTPNPASNLARLSFFMGNEGTYAITLNSAQGKIIFQQSLYAARPGWQQVDIPLTELPSGLYFCTLDVEGKKEVLKLIIE